MKPNTKLAETKTPDGHRLALYEHDGDFFMRLDGQELMHSLSTASEVLLGELGARKLKGGGKARVLIGGLGLGFSLKSLLQGAGKDVTVHVAELMPEVVEWNRQFLKNLNGKLLDDARVEVLVEDVCDIIAKIRDNPYDVILLDVDNGPSGMLQQENNRLYSQNGIRRIQDALAPQGRVAIWSATADRFFKQRLSKSGMRVEVVPAKTHANAKRFAHVIYVADKK